MNEMKCPFCGKDIPDDSNFCPECGKRVKPKISKKNLIVILSLVAVAVIVALVLLLSNKSSDSDDEKEPTIAKEATAYAKKMCECQDNFETGIDAARCVEEIEKMRQELEKKYGNDSVAVEEFQKVYFDYMENKCVRESSAE